MTDMQIFENPEFGKIRTIEADGDSWIVAADVCKALGVANGRTVTARLDEDEKAVYVVDTLGGKQKATCVNEAGLYAIIMTVDPSKAKARGVSKEEITRKQEQLKKFKRWVTHDVLPSIRKHGAYITPNKLSEMLRRPESVMEMLSALSEEQKKNAELTEQNTALIAENERITPYAKFGEAVLASDTTILIGMLATLLQQNGLDIGQNRLFARLRKEGYLIDQKGDRWNTPTQQAMKLGIFEVDTKLVQLPSHNIGKITYTTKVTPKGQKYFIDKYVFNREVASLDDIPELVG